MRNFGRLCAIKIADIAHRKNWVSRDPELHLSNHRFRRRSCGPAARCSDNRLGLIAVVFLTLAACGSNPPVISGDTSCERFRHISATPAQIKVFADNWEVMETYADSVVSHNIEYDRHCLGVAP
jgi:hypothetical protein